MGLLDRFRRSLQDRAGIPPSQREVGPTASDLEAFQAALLREAERLGRTRLALSVFLEHSDYDSSRVDLFAMLQHLAAQGLLADFEQDSFGNSRFDVAPLRQRLDP